MGFRPTTPALRSGTPGGRPEADIRAFLPYFLGMGFVVQLMTYEELTQGWDASIPENNPPFLVSDIPTDLQVLVPYAQVFGISDDGYRWDLLKRTPRTLALHVRSAVLAHDDALSVWLIGLEANGSYTAASDAFTALLIAAEEISPEG
jgi:hypothetical protein